MAFLTEAANRGSVSTGFNIDNSLKLEEDNTEYLYYTPSSQTDYERMTFSIWIKRTELTGSGNPTRLAEFGNGTANTTNLRIGFDTSDRLFIYGNSIVWRETKQSFRDLSAWYHLFFKFDTTTPGGISNNRIRVWVNGSMIEHTDYNTVNNPGAGTAMGFNRTNRQTIGQQQEGGVIANNGFNGYIAQAWGSGGTPPDVTDFGEYDDNNIWIPKDISELSIPDSNGFFLDFSNSSDLGNDSSSNNNDFTLNNIAAADQATDTPTNNFCTLNSNFMAYYYKAPTDGGTYMPMNGINQYGAYAGTFGLTKGKWYYETYVDMRDSTYGLTVLVGIHTLEGNYHANNFMVDNTNQNSTAAYYLHGGHYYSWDSGARVVDSTLGGVGSAQVGQFIGIALNLDDNQISFYINGSAVTNGTNLALNDAGDETDAGTFALPAFSVYTNNHTVNFGGYTRATISSAQSDANGYGTFEHAPPSGYYAICTKNLAEYG